MRKKTQNQQVTDKPEDKLDQSSRHNELLLTAVGEDIYGISRDGPATFVNPAAAEMTGWLDTDLLGKPIHDLHRHTKVDGSPYPREYCPIYAATNRDLKAGADVKLFREDLYYRLNVFPVEVVPLRSRKSDIPSLAAHFISLVCKRLNRTEPRLSLSNVKQLQAFDWPGNIRELQNVIERALIISQDGRLMFDLPGMDIEPESLDLTTDSLSAGSDDNQPFPYTEEERLKRDRINILAALKTTNGKISGKQGAAELLGIKPTTLASRMNALSIEK